MPRQSQIDRFPGIARVTRDLANRGRLAAEIADVLLVEYGFEVSARSVGRWLQAKPKPTPSSAQSWRWPAGYSFTSGSVLDPVAEVVVKAYQVGVSLSDIAQQLERQHGIKASYSTVRRWLVDRGLYARQR